MSLRTKFPNLPRKRNNPLPSHHGKFLHRRWVVTIFRIPSLNHGKSLSRNRRKKGKTTTKRTTHCKVSHRSHTKNINRKTSSFLRKEETIPNTLLYPTFHATYTNKTNKCTKYRSHPTYGLCSKTPIPTRLSSRPKFTDRVQARTSNTQLSTPHTFLSYHRPYDNQRDKEHRHTQDTYNHATRTNRLSSSKPKKKRCPPSKGAKQQQPYTKYPHPNFHSSKGSNKQQHTIRTRT